MIKFIISATWISKIFHKNPYIHSCKNGVSSRRSLIRLLLSLGLLLQCKWDLERCLEDIHHQKCRFATGTNCLIRLDASVNEQVPEGRPVTESQVDDVSATFVRSPRKSTWHAARQLNMPRTTLHNILQKHWKYKSYSYQLLQHWTVQEREVR